MQKNIQQLIESILRLRRKLAELETRRVKNTPAGNAGIWQDFMDVTRRLEQADEELRQTCRQLSEDLNLLRTDLIQHLEKYNRLREQIKQVEEQFLLNIVRPGQRLKEAIHHRNALEDEYQRIQRAIQHGDYTNLQALQADIRQVLVFSETVNLEDEDPQETEDDDEADLLKQLNEITVDDLEEFISIEELITEFKRVVLPAIHPDTSGTPGEVFKTVYEAYQKKDPLLMEAYVVQYRGEMQLDPQADPLECIDVLLAARKRCQRLSGRLRRRMDRLEKELVEQEIENPDRLQEKMQLQRQEIVERIRAEAEQILYWREKIEGLVDVYQDWHGQTGEER